MSKEHTCLLERFWIVSISFFKFVIVDVPGRYILSINVQFTTTTLSLGYSLLF